MNRKWEFYQQDEELVQKIAKEHNISELLAAILVNRNIIDKKEIDVFLNPTRNDFHNPLLMPDMEKAVSRILKAIENMNTILEDAMPRKTKSRYLHFWKKEMKNLLFSLH